MKKSFLFIAILCAIFSAYFFLNESSETHTKISADGFSYGGKEEQNARQLWHWKMLRDPATGKIPDGIRKKEIEFAKTLPNDISLSKSSGNENFVLQGPFNIGGRTRALAIDVSNENIIFAGSVSGGLYRSADAGNSWTKVTTPSQNLGVTAIVQDKRPGKQNIWYFSTGEGYGTSASGGKAFLLGDGMFKSVDSGFTWTPIDATDNGNPQSFSTNWQILWNVATHPNDTQDILFAAAYGTIYRSLNGGITWSGVLSSGFGPASYFTDVAVATNKTVYATLSSDGNKKGIWRSADGISAFVNITPPNFAAVYDRNVIGIDPNDENIVYFFAYTPGYGKMSLDFQADTEWVSLWKYQYLSGDGTGAGGMWTDLSQNLPFDGSQFGNIVVQGSYNMFVRVMPGNPNVVFIGATNLYRSTDGFTSPNNTTWIGGYGIGSTLPFYTVYPNHHPDQHNLVFLPSNPNVMYSACDGGVYKTLNCLDANVSWQDLNRGYYASQFYTVAIDHGTPGSPMVTGGLQDWGSWLTNTTDPLAFWNYPSTGDGSFCAIADGGNPCYFSRQNAKIMKAMLDNNGNVTAFRRIDPIGPVKGNYMFINPFILDASDNNVMYLSEGENLWRNNDLSQINLDGSWDSISTGWFKYSFSLADTNSDITALACSKTNPVHRLYFGTDNKKIYRMDNANTGDPTPVEITSTLFPSGGYVSGIAVHPYDGNKIMAVFSNYNVYSIFYSEDAGANWYKTAGNLEQNSSGSGNGPSIRYASILPVANGTIYLVATSTGLYATDSLYTLADSTKWIQQGANTIGNVVTVMTDVRESDGFVAIATHGNSMFTTQYSNTWEITGAERSVAIQSSDFTIFPNPNDGEFNVYVTELKNMNKKIEIYSVEGKKIHSQHLTSNNEQLSINLTSGIYYCNLISGGKNSVKKFVVVK